MNKSQAPQPPVSGGHFKELLQASFKSSDTEEWLDVHFTRPIGLVFALFWNKLGVHPNAITILSIFLGVGAGWMFHYTDLAHNIWGVVLLMFANFCDSTDGQMARLTGKKTLIGRMLDGFSGDVWFVAVYAAIAWRLWSEFIPFTDDQWGPWSWALCAVAGFTFHSPQSSLSDYYRQIHLFFLKGKAGSELDSSEQQKRIYEETPWKGNVIYKLFLRTYINYTSSQEKQTPEFQRLWKTLKERYGSVDKIPQEFRDQFRSLSLPMMKWANILTFNTRAITFYISCLLDLPWLYWVMEMTVFTALYLYMRKTHEGFCKSLKLRV